MKKRKAYTREERCLMIVQALVVEVEKWGIPAEMTVAEIAHKLDVTPSTKLRIIVNEMVLDGVLKSQKQKHPGIAGFRVLYRLSDENHTTVLKTAKKAAYGEKRHIRVNTAQGSFWESLS